MAGSVVVGGRSRMVGDGWWVICCWWWVVGHLLLVVGSGVLSQF